MRIGDLRLLDQSILQGSRKGILIILTYIIYNSSLENSKKTEWSFLKITATLNTLDSLYQLIRILSKILLI